MFIKASVIKCICSWLIANTHSSIGTEKATGRKGSCDALYAAQLELTIIQLPSRRLK